MRTAPRPLAPDSRSRRALVAAAAGSAAFALAPVASRASLTVHMTRAGWRYCQKCHVLFDSEGGASRCAAGARHVAQGLEFRLTYDEPETRTAQANWRTCRRCQTMFFAGFPQRGSCPAGGGHVGDTNWNYVLPHDVAQTARSQGGWRFCGRCYAMFFDGYSDKGVCPGGGGHAAHGFVFVLPRAR